MTYNYRCFVQIGNDPVEVRAIDGTSDSSRDRSTRDSRATAARARGSARGALGPSTRPSARASLAGGGGAAAALPARSLAVEEIRVAAK
jgi:hypothetical protein